MTWPREWAILSHSEPLAADPSQDPLSADEYGALNSISEPICVVDENGTILGVNQAWSKFASENGADEKATGQGANYLVTCQTAGPADTDAQSVGCGIRDVLAGRRDLAEHEYPCEVGTLQHWFCARITRFAGAGPARAVVRHEDVTTRKHAEIRVQRLLRMYAALSAANVAIAQCVSSESLLQRVCDIAVELGDFKIVAVRLIDPRSRLLQDSAHSGDDKGYFSSIRTSMDPEDPDGGGPIANALREGRPALAQDLAAETAMRPALDFAARAGVRSYAMFPLFVDGDVVGAFTFYAEQPDIFEPDLRRLLQDLASGLSLGLQNLKHEAQRMQSENLLRRHAHRGTLLAELASLALDVQAATQLMERAVATAQEALNFSQAGIFELAADERGLLLRAAAGWAPGDAVQGVLELDEAGEVGYALSQKTPVMVEDFSLESRFSISRVAASSNRTCAIAVAIPGRRMPYGVLAIYASERREISVADAQFLQSIGNLVAAAIHRDHASEHWAYASQFDSHTGLPNRQLFRDRLTQAVIQAERTGRAVATLCISLGRFKIVNETFGHLVGDELLLMVSRRISSSLRPGDTIGRLEGDVFGVVLADLSRVEDAVQATQKIVEALGKSFDIQGENLFVMVSIGIALHPGNGDTQDELMKNAYIAMHRAKHQPGSAYQFYTAEMNARSAERLRLEVELREAIEQERFVIHYQAKVDIATGRITGAEALLRWMHPQRGLVFPGEFIGILEETGLILRVGAWVLRKTCEQISRWTEAGLPIPKVSINVSPRQFENRDFAIHVGDIIAACGIDAKYIELEITESMLMVDPEHAVRELSKLRQLGVSLSVDDFGTGYSSLAYLKRFPLDTLKIDIAFIRETCTDPDSAAITLAIISLAHNLRLKVVAEGVETEPQFNFLARHGCDQLQGYLFSRPIAAHAFADMLANDIRLNVTRTDRSVQPTVLIVDSNPVAVSALVDVLEGESYRIFTAESPKDAYQLLSEIEFQIVISSSAFGAMSGVEFLARVRQMYPHIGRVIAFDVGDSQNVSDAVNAAGVHKSLLATWSPEKMRSTIRAVLAEIPSSTTTSGTAEPQRVVT